MRKQELAIIFANYLLGLFVRDRHGDPMQVTDAHIQNFQEATGISFAEEEARLPSKYQRNDLCFLVMGEIAIPAKIRKPHFGEGVISYDIEVTFTGKGGEREYHRLYNISATLLKDDPNEE